MENPLDVKQQAVLTEAIAHDTVLSDTSPHISLFVFEKIWQQIMK